MKRVLKCLLKIRLFVDRFRRRISGATAALDSHCSGLPCHKFLGRTLRVFSALELTSIFPREPGLEWRHPQSQSRLSRTRPVLQLAVSWNSGSALTRPIRHRADSSRKRKWLAYPWERESNLIWGPLLTSILKLWRYTSRHCPGKAPTRGLCCSSRVPRDWDRLIFRSIFRSWRVRGLIMNIALSIVRKAIILKSKNKPLITSVLGKTI